ncbi:MAG: uracil phosphoribosyltransferase [Acidobacteriota bacterium]
MAGEVIVVDHPLVQHKLTQMRSKERTIAGFRRLVREVSMLLAYEITRDMPVTYETIETPLQTMEAPVIEGKKVVLVAVLRAGMGLLDGMLEILPSARVGHIGLQRDPKTLEAVEYYNKLPDGIEERDVLLLDPMLATGNTAIAAVSRVLEAGPRTVKFVCMLAAPEGIEALHAAHPDVPIYTAAVDERLNEKGYILPGLGDAGDRIYGTK